MCVVKEEERGGERALRLKERERERVCVCVAKEEE